MTKEQLYQLPDFGALFSDPRMKGILEYLKTEMPRMDPGEHSGDWYRGVHQTIRNIELLGIPPSPNDGNEKKIRSQYAEFPQPSPTLNRAF